MLQTDLAIHKGSWITKLVKHGKWYFISSLITKGFGIILLPVYTRYLSPEEWGIFETLNSITRFLPYFLSLYLDFAFIRLFHEYKYDKKELARLFSTIYFFVIFYGIIALVIILYSSYFWLPNLINVSVYPYAYLAFVPSLLGQIGQLGIVYLRQSLLSKQTAAIQCSATIINAVITLILLMLFNLGVIARLWGVALSSLFLFLYYTFYFYKQNLLILTFDFSLLIKCLFISVPLIPSVSSSWIAGLSDRLVIAKFVNLEAVGIYSLGFQIATIMYFIQDSITQVLMPLIMSGLEKDKKMVKTKIKKFSLFLWMFMLLVNLALFLFSKEIIIIFADESYRQSYKIIPIIGFIYVMSCQYRLFIGIIAYYKKTWVLASAAILSALFNLGLNIIFVPKFGYIAASITTIISTTVYSLWIYLWSQKYVRINLFWKKMFFVFMIYLVSVYFLFNYLFAEEISVFIVVEKIFVWAVCFGIFILIAGTKFLKELKSIFLSANKSKKEELYNDISSSEIK